MLRKYRVFKILLLCFLSVSIYADYTYLTYDKIVFGNGGGFELVPSGNKYRLQVLNLSGSDTEYTAKALSTEGKLKSVVPTNANAYNQSDHMLMATAATFTDSVPSFNGGYFPEDRVLFTGEYLGKFMLLNEDTIAGYKMVTEGNYSRAPIYLQNEYGNIFIGSTNEDLPVLSIYPTVNNTPYWGINTTSPLSMLTVSGNLLVENGTPYLSEPFGTLEALEELGGFPTIPLNSYTVVSEFEFELTGLVSQNVTISGQAQATGMAVAPYTAIRLSLYYYNGSSWVTYTDPTTGLSVADLTYKQDDGSDRFSTLFSSTMTSVLLDIDPAGNGTAQYKVQLSVLKGEDLDYYLTDTYIMLFGLPEGSYASLTPASSPVTATDTVDIPTKTVVEIDGNYLTDQLLSFGSGGAIYESGNNIILTDGDDYIDFRAGGLGFGEFHSIDSLKVTDNTVGAYPFKLVDSGVSSLGFAPYGTFYAGPLATQNIQTLNSGGSPYNTTLKFESDLYLGGNSSIRTDGIISPNVEIGEVISDTSFPLNLAGDLLFTGTYYGDLVIITSNEIQPYHYGYNGAGEYYINHADDVITLSLDPTKHWHILFYGLLTVRTRDNNSPSKENYVQLVIEDSSNNISLSEKRETITDRDHIFVDTLYNYEYKYLIGDTYKFYLKSELRYFNDNDPIQNKAVDDNNDGWYVGATNLVYRLGGYIAVIAIPAD